jgi:hypothetical protein
MKEKTEISILVNFLHSEDVSRCHGLAPGSGDDATLGGDSGIK